MSSELITGLSMAIPVVGALVVGIWRFSGLAKTLELKLESLEVTITEFEKDRVNVAKIPDLERRIGQSENQIQTIQPRLAVLERITSTRFMHAVRPPAPSRPEEG